MGAKEASVWDLKIRISKLLYDESLSDVVFLVDDPPQRFPSHRLVLAAGSQVFKAMLFGKLAEKTEIRIPDVTCGGFRNMLRYLYTDAAVFEDEWEAIEAAYVAQKYLIKELLVVCEDYLLKVALKFDTVFLFYDHAELLEMERLKSRCLRFVSRHADDIFHSQSLVNSSESTLRNILKMDVMHVESEKAIIAAIWMWGMERCKERTLKCTQENIRKVTNELLKYVRFLSLAANELDDIFSQFDLLDESEQLAILWNSVLPKKMESVHMPSNLCSISRKRSISNSLRLELPAEYRYDGNMTNYSVKHRTQQITLSIKGPGVTIVGVVIAYKIVPCYSSQHRRLTFELTINNKTTHAQAAAKLFHTCDDQQVNSHEQEVLLDDFVAFSEGDVGCLVVQVAGEGVRIMENLKEEFSVEIARSEICFNFKEEDDCKLLCPIKEIMLIPGS